MSVDAYPQDEEYVLICGVGPEAFQQLDELLGNFHLRFTYADGNLEMRRIVHGVAPEMYARFLEIFQENYLPHSYDGWTLEMMTPRRDHEWLKRLIGRMLEAMALALKISIQSASSTTLHSPRFERGLQPDESYYVRYGRPIPGAETYTPGEDPPPDLAIEVEVTHPLVKRLPLYADVGVREIWQWRKERMEFLCLDVERRYQPIDRSVAFPFLAAADFTRFLEHRQSADENELVQSFVDWAREAYRSSGSTET